MNIEIDIDGLHCDGKLVMVWADHSDIPSRERLINEFEVPEFYDDEEIAELENKIEELEDEIEDIVKNCKNPLDRLLDDDMPWRKLVDVLKANLPKGYSIKPQIVETGFAEDLKNGLHKD